MKFAVAITAVAALFAPQVLAGCYDGQSTIPFTLYWVAKQGTTDVDNNGNTLHLSGDKTHPIKSKGQTIAMVDKNTFEKSVMEGTCLLEDGRLINLNSPPNDFFTLDRGITPYGVGYDTNIPLIPFVSIATNDMSHGQKVYVKELDGKKLPNGRIHNGCLRKDDDSWSFGSCHIDWFVLSYDNYVVFNTLEKVHATIQDCEILDYITPSVKLWALLGKGKGGPLSFKQSNKHNSTAANPKSTNTNTKTKKGSKPLPKNVKIKGAPQNCRNDNDCSGRSCCHPDKKMCTMDAKICF
ncbi:hypothetical protein BC936DRAFT_139022 [Jimgerdemannia flammicorona]|uniref:Uncharacterized protein n=1 Tax=Jimgerdemannia flammicorona TaxID=994334 RepID=A0A433BAS9_9FUNG|nr:hypothetical protein BC936DRAFT_139022 [Jimgerdemannia flammicorona]